MTRLYEDHRDYVLAVLARRCGWLSAEEREEALHDAFLVLLEKQRDGRLELGVMREPQVRAYITRTAIHKALDEGKRAGRNRSAPVDDERLLERLSDQEPGPEERLERREAEARVRRLIAELPERQQLIVKLRYFLHRSPAEIQEYLGITERTYRRQLERATRAVSERYEMNGGRSLRTNGEAFDRAIARGRVPRVAQSS